MKTVCIDYSEIYYPELAKIAVPAKRSGKFVQIRKDDREYLVFSPKEYTPFHADIVKRFCKDRELKGAYDRKSKCFRISDAEWVVIGGGKFEIDKAAKLIRLYDDSMAYGRFDRRRLKEKVLSIMGMSGYTVVIE